MPYQSGGRMLVGGDGLHSNVGRLALVQAGGLAAGDAALVRRRPLFRTLAAL